MKVSALSAAAVPTGSRGADRYQGGMLCLPPPRQMPIVPSTAYAPGLSKTALSFVYSQSFQGIFESHVAVFDSVFIKDNQAKLRKYRELPQRVENHCTPGRVRAIGRCYGCGPIRIVWFSKIRWTFRYARSQMSAVPPSASVP